MSSAFLAPVDITNSDAPSDRHCEIASNELVYCIFLMYLQYINVVYSIS